LAVAELSAGSVIFLDAWPDEQRTVAGSPCTPGVLENLHDVACVTVTVAVSTPPLLGSADLLSLNEVIVGRDTSDALVAATAGTVAAARQAAAAGISTLAGIRVRNRIVQPCPSARQLHRAEPFQRTNGGGQVSHQDAKAA